MATKRTGLPSRSPSFLRHFLTSVLVTTNTFTMPRIAIFVGVDSRAIQHSCGRGQNAASFHACARPLYAHDCLRHVPICGQQNVFSMALPVYMRGVPLG